jgi:type II secretory ATPase GspE/PulE/Tfp pilus assembly ATPase PilB-like protein
MSIEDPVEYRLKGTNQLQVDYRRGFDFAAGLRAILRQDPDTIMVGEIRDEETAKIAIRASLTGVLVLTTLHGNDAPSTISSLYQYNIPGFLISNAVIGVLAQRLVRRICPACKQEFHPGPEILQQVGIAAKSEEEPPAFFRGQGCAKCFHTGYAGRTGVFEVMEVTEEIKDLIFRETAKEAIQKLAVEQGMQSLAASGRRKILSGETTVEEFFRVIFV